MTAITVFALSGVLLVCAWFFWHKYPEPRLRNVCAGAGTFGMVVVFAKPILVLCVVAVVVGLLVALVISLYHKQTTN